MLEAATRDSDPERSGRAKGILTSLRIDRILGDVESGLMKMESLEAQVSYSQARAFRGVYRHAEGGRKFTLHFECLESPRKEGAPAILRKWSIASDGATVWQVHNLGTQNGENLYEKFSAAGYERRDLGCWSHYGCTFLPPPQVFRLVRSCTSFDSFSEDVLEGQPVWVINGGVAESRHSALTYSGFRSSHTGILRKDAEEAMRVRTIRLISSKIGGGLFQLEGRQKDGATQWFLRMTNAKPPRTPDGESFSLPIPRDAQVLPGD